MGFYVNFLRSDFHIKGEDKAACLSAIKAMKGKETIKDSSGFHFPWVSPFYDAETLPEAMEAWRWPVEEDWAFQRDIIGIEFSGEKWGDDELLFEAIAPWVKEGSFIEMFDELKETWRWVFRGGKVKRIFPTWEE